MRKTPAVRNAETSDVDHSLTVEVPEEKSLEAYRVISGMLARKTGAIPVDLLARHIIRVTEGFDWPVQCAATEALLRRLRSGSSDELRVAVRPRGSSPFGLYQTRRAGDQKRPYDTVIASIDPIRAECGCPDFIRNSLGFCKHVAVALASAVQLRQKRKRPVSADKLVPLTGLQWFPSRSGRGDGERLGHLKWYEDELQTRRSRRVRELLDEWFTSPDRDATREVRNYFPHDPVRRTELLKGLRRLLDCCEQRDGASFHPAVSRLIREEQERIAGVSHGMTSRSNHLAGMKRRLYPYQQESVTKFLRSGRLLLADDMGLGKTTQAIACCHAMWRAGRVSRGLLVVPAPLKEQWEREWNSCTSTPIAIVSGTPSDREAVFQKTRKGFLIVNYEQVLRDLSIIREWGPEFIVLDEAQRIKNWETKIAAHIKSLQPAYRLMCTGTPMENRLEELASLMDWIDDQALEPKWRLVPWHSLFADGKRQVIGARHLDHLRARLEHRMVRRVRREILDQLPPRTDTVVPVEMTPDQIEYHDSFRQPIAQLMQTAERRPLTQAEFLRLMSMLTEQRIVSDGYELVGFEEHWRDLKQIIAPSLETVQSLRTPKLLALRDLITSLVLEQRRKVVVFSQWTRMLKLCQWGLSAILAEAGLRSVFFTGEEGQKRRTANVVDFHDDPSCVVMFLSDAGSVGLNLQHAASACINIDLPWNPAVLEQRIGRIYRLGQSEPIDVFNLVSNYGIEGRICGILDSKQALFSGLFDGTSDTVNYGQETGLLKQLARLMGDGGDAGGSGGSTVEVVEAVELADVRDEIEDEGHLGDVPSGEGGGGAIGLMEEIRGGSEATASSPSITNLFQDVSIRRDSDGGVTISATKESATALVALFEGMAGLFRRVE